MSILHYLHLIYLFTTIFGLGVVILDLFGVFVHTGHGDTNTGHVGHADHDSSHDADHGHSHEGSNNNHIPILSILRYLRMLIYFCAGFGPLGLLAQYTGSSLLGMIAWSILGGIATTSLGIFFFRLQQKDIDSSIRTEDLFLGQAQVIVPISNGNMGKVRILIGQSVAERYALAENSTDSFSKDAIVQVVQVTDECVYVRPTMSNESESNIARSKPISQLQK